MNREIKFRAWLEDEKVMLPFGFGNIDDSKIITGTGDDTYMFNYYDAVIMQYTGLKDKNGKEIYEGDVVRSHSYSPNGQIPIEGIVAFDSGRFEVKDQYDFNFALGDYSETNGNPVEIIGNIYETPEKVKA